MRGLSSTTTATRECGARVVWCNFTFNVDRAIFDVSTTTMEPPRGGQPQTIGPRGHLPEIFLEHMLPEQFSWYQIASGEALWQESLQMSPLQICSIAFLEYVGVVSIGEIAPKVGSESSCIEIYRKYSRWMNCPSRLANR